MSNKTYRLEFNRGLSSSNWNALHGDVIGISDTASKLDALGASNWFSLACFTLIEVCNRRCRSCGHSTGPTEAEAPRFL